MRMMNLMKMKTMKNKIINKLEWWFDYYFAWMLYNGNKQDRYIEYMEKKWGQKKNEFEN